MRVTFECAGIFQRIDRIFRQIVLAFQNETPLSKIFCYFEQKPFCDNILDAFVAGDDAEFMESSK